MTSLDPGPADPWAAPEGHGPPPGVPQQPDAPASRRPWSPSAPPSGGPWSPSAPPSGGPWSPSAPAWQTSRPPSAAPAWPPAEPPWPSSPLPVAPPWPPSAWEAGYSPAAGPQAPANPWAVVALVTGLLALVPVALGAGAVALVQLRERPGRGRGLAIGGMVAAGCWSFVGLLVVAVVALVGTSEPHGLVAGRVGDLGSTVYGNCLASPGVVVPCSQPHDGEIYLVRTLDEQRWPGEEDLAGTADDACYDAFEDYVGRGYEESDLDYAVYAPDAAEWADGERRVVCVVVPYEDDELVGSVVDSGR